MPNELFGNNEIANTEIAEYLSSSFSGKYDSRFSVFGNSEQLEMLAHAAQRVEDSLSETESKLRNSGLVYGDSNSIRDKSADIKSEIDHHNRIEDEGLAPDDGLSHMKEKILLVLLSLALCLSTCQTEYYPGRRLQFNVRRRCSL